MENVIAVLAQTLKETRDDIKLTIKLSEDKTAVHHLHGRLKDIDEVLQAVELEKTRKELQLNTSKNN